MSETTYFFQGGRKIEIEKDDSEITIHANSEVEARSVAARVGVELRTTETTSPGLVRAAVVGDRERSIDQLRSENSIVHHVYHNRQAPESEYLITESFFIKFKRETPDHRILDYFTAEHLIVEQDMGEKTYLVRVTSATGRNPIRTANSAASRDDVEYAEPNLVRRLTRFAFIPPDTLFSRQWHLHAPTAGQELVAKAGIFAPEAWDITRGQRAIVIAVADDGFDLTHPDFQGEGKLVAQLNATPRSDENNATIDWDENVSPRPGDYHGTPCLGVAVAEGNGTGVIGVAPECSLVAVRFPLSMTDAHFIVMFEKVSALADIISCSWGYGPTDATMSSPLRDAMARLALNGGRRGKGLIFCIAAGNNNCPVQDLQNTRTYRYRDQLGIIRSYSGPIDRWIAAHPDVITVSASTSLKTRAAYSSWGKQICVCAPSDNWDDLGQITPPGRGITTTDNEGFGLNSDFTPGSRFTGRFGGTSSATPTVAGVCGLILSVNSSLTALEVREILQKTADKDLSLDTDTPVNEEGTFNNEGFSLWFGHGKVNAFRAVKDAIPDIIRIDIRNDTSLDIPDAGTPVFSSIEVPEEGTIIEFRVQIHISHSFVSDLRVDLLAPEGTGVVLHNKTGGSDSNLIRTYSAQDVPALRPLLNRSIRGTWQLRIQDTFVLDIGQLNWWRIVGIVQK